MTHEAIPLLDHIVVATPDLAATVAECAERTGVAAVPGGRHPGFGTLNYLLSLGADSYLEFIAIDPQNSTHTGAHPFHLDGLRTPRVSTWAIHPADLEATRRRALQAGIDVGVAGDGARTTTSGERLAWRLTPPVHSEPDGVIPFLIDWLGAPSPAATIGPTAELVEFSIAHPRPHDLAARLRVLGTQAGVRRGELPGCTLVVTGPAGRWRVSPRPTGS